VGDTMTVEEVEVTEGAMIVTSFSKEEFLITLLKHLERVDIQRSRVYSEFRVNIVAV
jgi:hypothetical protein